MKLVVLGAKESGTGAALLGKKLGYSVFLSDMGNVDDKYKLVLDKEQIPYEEGLHSIEKIIEADLVVKSPGIPDKAPVVKALNEKGIEIISEIEFAGRHSQAQMICITGSNGKTTTTLLTHHILKCGGIDAGLAGNVGYSLAAQVAENAHPVYVVELSSFQLDNMFRFRADVAVITNITPDHLDRYDYKFENYIASKFRVLQNMDASGLFIYGKDNETAADWVKTMEIVPEVTSFTYADQSTGQNAWMDGDVLDLTLDGRHLRIHKDKISIQGRHNIYNAMAAILVAMKMNISDEKIEEGLRTFPQVEHRMERVLVADGVTYINDSKATNVDSTWYALDSMSGPTIWIAGGTDKGNDYACLTDLARQKVKLLICMGLDNQKLLDSFTGICPLVSTHSLADTMAEVVKHAEQGDTVLLSPCCASFDLFRSYEDRGKQFKQAVNKIGKINV
ncbi:UDP-N-acetylmuramoyl-L-alanine--D-glutamate ligase [Odoribacter sp. OttesenSCG-928-J03]|nr:UDP-N-acetylmuramoyl-L-alanine--D-glutamate ligase [Odoribacter sp. OttesenSCG-928-J03]